MLENVHSKYVCHFNRILQEHLVTRHSHSYNLALTAAAAEFLSRETGQNCNYIRVNM